MLNEYKALILKMHQNYCVNNQYAHNLDLLFDLEVMLGLFCSMPMLKGLNELIKFHWAFDLNTSLENLNFQIFNMSIMMHCPCFQTTLYVPMM
jgi:hypothetical protein